MKKENQNHVALFEHVHCEDGQSLSFEAYASTEEEAVKSIYTQVTELEGTEVCPDEIEGKRRIGILNLHTGKVSWLKFNVVLFHYLFDEGRVTFDELKESLEYTVKYPPSIPLKYLTVLLDNNGFKENDLVNFPQKVNCYLIMKDGIFINFSMEVSIHIVSRDMKNCYPVCLHTAGFLDKNQRLITKGFSSETLFRHLIDMLSGETTVEDMKKIILKK